MMFKNFIGLFLISFLLILSGCGATDSGHADSTSASTPPTNNTSSSDNSDTNIETDPVEITVHPIDISAYEGEPVTLSVEATGSSLSFKWQKAAQDKWETLKEGSSEELTFPGIEQSDAGSYRVIVSNDVSSATSNDVYITVKDDLEISSNPTNVTITENESAVFSVSASGYGNLSYQWYYGSTELKQSAKHDGANSPTLTVTAVTTSDVGAYYAIVTNSEGRQATSNTANLRVNGPATIVQHPLSVTTISGSTVELSATATGTLPISYQWQRSVQSGSWSNISNANQASYSFTASSNGESYRVLVNNVSGIASASNAATITLITPVTITSQPVSANETVFSGESVSFSVSATGSTPSYQWRKDTQPIDGANGSTLTLSNVTLSNEGTYDVIVSNSASSITSNAASLKLATVVSITRSPTNQTVNVGSSISISVSTSGTTPINYQWRKDGSNIPGATGTSFNITSSTLSDQGSYDVIVSNAGGTKTSSAATVTVHEVDSDLTVSVTAGGSISGDVNCDSTCEQTVSNDSSLSLIAVADEGFQFSHWNGGCEGQSYNCAIEVTEDTSTTAVFRSLSETDLCQGLVTDKERRSIESLDKPALLETVTDPAFGTVIRRITDIDGTGVAKPVYSTVQAWNADESKLLLYITRSDDKATGHYLYDGKTYEEIKLLDVKPTDLEDVFWDFEDPRYLYYFGHRYPYHQLIRYNVETDEKTVLRDFTDVCPGNNRIRLGGDVQTPSWNNNVFGLRCEDDYMWTYNVEKDEISGFTEAVESDLNFAFAPNSSPSGEYFYHRKKVYDKDMNELAELDLAAGGEHSSMGLTHDGHDAYIAVAFGSSPNGCNNDPNKGVGAAVLHTFHDGGCRVLVGQSNGWGYPPSGTHISAVSHKNIGWAAISSIGAIPEIGGGEVRPLVQEIYLANTDPNDPKVCRIAHHRSWGKQGSSGYMSEPHVVISPSGSRVIFGSDWDNSGSVDTYVIELPSYKN